MSFQATPEQQRAIDADGNVLVAAAAGSGKTAVLVERVMRLITDEKNPVGADEMLIVTFTNAAAAEMRARIERKLAQECAAHPENLRLAEQKHLLPSAKICTIDSFCIDLVRENFERAGVSPDFRIADEGTMRPMQDAAFRDTMNRFFERDGALFRDLLDITGADYDDRGFRSAVQEIFTASCNQPFADLYLTRLAQAGRLPFNAEHPWFRDSMRRARELIASMLHSCSTALDLAADAPGRTKGYLRALGEISVQLNDMLAAAESGNWDGLYDRIMRYDHSSLAGTSDGGLPELMAVKSIIGEIGKKEGKKALSAVIFADTAAVTRICERLEKPVQLLIEFVREYARTLFEKQQNENCYTFYNTEQMALAMLCEAVDGQIQIRADADIFLNRFREVLVDEYQDTNDLQDTLFKVLSNREEHLFAVGDVKQSIYAFRGANPDNFLHKKARAKPPEKAGFGDVKKIVLARNFRSRRGVCDYINFFFRRLMTAETGTLVYDGDEMLIPQDDFPKNGAPCAELLAIRAEDAPAADSDEDAQSDAALAVEARAIADYIRKTVESGAFLRKNSGELRPARYCDFAILMRNQKNRSALLAEELRRQGIPVSFSKENFLDTLEIKTFLALLEIIDNPKQDIPLLTAMMSPIFGFDAEETAALRADYPQGTLISAVTAAAGAGHAHAARMLERLSDMRADAAAMPVPRLLSRLLAETDYLNAVSGMPDGARRRANLLLLCDYAAVYAQDSAGALGGFLRMLRKLPASALKAAKTGGGENTVQIMSMHASKGLQFPICILCDLGVNMHRNTERRNLLFSPEDGIGFRFYDEQRQEKCTAPAFQILQQKKRVERLSEELRLLYVAMTRAEERLVILSYNKNLSGTLTNLSSRLLANDCKIGRELFYKTASMNDWVLMTALLHPDGVPLRHLGSVPLNPEPEQSRISVQIIDAASLPAADTFAAGSDRTAEPDKALCAALRENLSYRYPYAPLLEIEAKSTVSRLANSAESKRFTFTAKPAVLEENGISAAGRGTATHKVMQFIRFEEHVDIAAELERLCEWQFITEAQAKAVDTSVVQSFFDSPLYARILKSPDVRREMRFLTEVPAGVLNPGLSPELAQEKVVVQGAVDLCFREGGEIVIVDFKTDRVSRPEALAQTYREQLEFYARGCEKIFGLPVREKILYSFALKQEIPV